MFKATDASIYYVMGSLIDPDNFGWALVTRKINTRSIICVPHNSACIEEVLRFP